MKINQINRNHLIFYYCSLLLIILLSNNSFSNDNEIKGQTNYKWNGDTLLINLVINNNSRNSVYFQKEHWILEGDSKTNYYWFYCDKPDLVNQIIYFPSSYKDISFKEFSSYSLENHCFPKFVLLLPHDSVSIDICLVRFKNLLIDSLNYNFKFSIPIYESKILKKAANFFNLPFKDIIINSSDFQLIFTKSHMKYLIGITDIWIKNDEREFCTKKYFKKEQEYDFYQIFKVYNYLIFISEIHER